MQFGYRERVASMAFVLRCVVYAVRYSSDLFWWRWLRRDNKKMGARPDSVFGLILIGIIHIATGNKLQGAMETT